MPRLFSLQSQLYNKPLRQSQSHIQLLTCIVSSRDSLLVSRTSSSIYRSCYIFRALCLVCRYRFSQVKIIFHLIGFFIVTYEKKKDSSEMNTNPSFESNYKSNNNSCYRLRAITDISPNIICHTKSDLISSLFNGIATSILFVGLGSKLMTEWNSLSNHIRESNSIAAFKRNFLNFIEDNQNFYFYICIYFFLHLNQLGIPSMVRQRLWLSPSP